MSRRPTRCWIIKDFSDGSMGVCLDVTNHRGVTMIRNAVRCIPAQGTPITRASHEEARECLLGTATCQGVLEGNEYEVFVSRSWTREQQIAYAQGLLRNWFRRLRAAVALSRARAARWRKAVALPSGPHRI